MAAIDYQHTLTFNGVSKILEDAPAGWENWTRRYYRHLTYHGILLTDATAQRFVYSGGFRDDGGYYFIKDAFDLQGIKAEIYYTRKIKDPFSKDWVVDYTGLLDLSTEGGYQDVNYEWIEVETISSAKLQNFIANKGIDFDINSLIAFNGTEVEPFVNYPQRCLYPRVYVYLEALSNGIIGGFESAITGEDIKGDAPYTREFVTNNIPDRIITISSSKTIYENSDDDVIDLTLELEADLNHVVSFTPDTSIDKLGNVEVNLYLLIKDDGGATVETNLISSRIASVGNITVPETQTLTGDISYSYPTPYEIPIGYSIQLYGEWEITAIGMDVDLDWAFNIDSLYIYEKDYSLGVNVYAFQTHEVATRLMQLTTGETNTDKLLISNIFGRTDSEFQTYEADGALAYLSTISGNAMRLKPYYSTRVNFDDWFKTIDYMANICMWYDSVNDVFRVEEKEQVYRNEEILNIGEVSNLITSIHSDSYFSNIDSGTQEKGEYDERNGALEYNIQSNHSVDMPSTKTKKIRAIYNTDTLSQIYSQKYTYVTEGDSDSDYDARIFITELNSDLEAISNSDIGTFEGFLGIDERRNGNYTPRKCLVNNANHLGACLYKEADGVIQFTGNIKDLDISYDGVNESDPITKAELGEPLYYPEVYDFDGYVDAEIITQLNTDPHGYITFNDSDGNEYKGFVLEIEIQDFKGTATYKLLRLNPNR